MNLIHTLSGFIASTLVAKSVAIAQDKLEIFNVTDESSVRIIDHGAWDRFLKSHIEEIYDGRTVVDYGAVSVKDRLSLKRYLFDLQGEDPTTLSKDEAFVYWINLYNALTVDLVLENYPVKSIRDIRSNFRPGPWQRKIAKIRNTSISLDNIEHGILRAFWNDNRVHYAVNCASIGCPNLMGRAFTVDGLDETLDALACDYVNHSRGFVVDEKGHSIASSIYNWFKADFGGDDASIAAHLSLYANPERREELDSLSVVDRYCYDWSLNDVD